ncbi:hypothetical protein [Actinoplanes sp. NPDC049316]|uniref:hypothetical protein n=1 Tax=Actinoplanes sp. NPDC049316 TaxID=3154727 RepID=UPI00343A0DDE
MKLSIGARPAAKAFGVVFGLVFAAAGAAFALLPLVFDGWLQRAFGSDESCPSPDEIAGIPPDLLPPEVRECVSGGAWLSFEDGLGPLRLLGLIGVPVVLLGGYLALKSLRTAGWLDGTSVSIRGALRTKTVDLSRAEISAMPGHQRDRTFVPPSLTARDRDSGATVTIPLHGIGSGQLPSSQLRALAQAMTASPEVAAQLRVMADNPLGLPGTSIDRP